jgi:hypothetical protein
MLSLLFVLLQGQPSGPDICDLLGFCQRPPGSTGSNLLYLATALMMAGVLVHRSRRKR